MKLDSTSWRILEVLQTDARASYAEIGKQVGLTPPAVAERMRKMEGAGIITGYHAHVSADALGFSLMGLVQLQNTRPDSAKVVELAKTIPEVLSCDTTTGQNNFLIRIVARNRSHFSSILGRFLEYGSTISSVVLDRPVVFKPITHETWQGADKL